MSLEQESQELIPTEQQTITFYGKPIVVIRLSDGRPGVVLRHLCDNLQLDPGAQVARIKRTEALTDDLVYVQVQTEGGFQKMPTLVLHAVPFWLAGIDPKRVREEVKPDVIRYQREVVDVLYTWAQQSRAIAAPTNLVPSEPITEPTRPAPDAPRSAWIEYHQQMAALLEWQDEIETWRSNVESRLEGLEAMTNLIPEILERIGPEKLTPEHQGRVQHYVSELHEATGKHQNTIHTDIKIAFKVPRYTEILEDDWPKLENWFKVQIERAQEK